MSKNKEISEDQTRLRSRRRVVIGLIIAVVVLALVAVFAVWWGQRQPDLVSQTEARTAAVERTSLVSAFVLSGNLGYGDVNTLGGGGGVVTKIPEAGEIVEAGQVVMEVEGVPVILLQGNVPLWREIGPGISGPDVSGVRAALANAGIKAGEKGKQTYDKDLSTAIAALYAAAGHKTVPPSAELQEIRKSAEAALKDAKSYLQDANQALTDARNQKPSESALVEADNAVNEAYRAYTEVLRGNCGTNEEGQPQRCTQEEILRAEEAYKLAVAQRDDLNKPPETKLEQAAVNTAQEAVTKAQSEYDSAMMNTIGPQSVLLVPDKKIRISSVLAKVGLPANEAVLTWTKPVLYGYVDLTEAQRRLMDAETTAMMMLPDGTEVAATIGEVIESKYNPQDESMTPARARLDIVDRKVAEDLDVGSITVSFVQGQVEDTLVVPVTALMALAEGGYCVQLTNGTLVPVKIGMVADTRVEIFSDQLNEGDEVIIP